LRFSIIIPTFNRPRELARCLRAIAGLDYPRDDFEVLIVDDGGSVDLGALVDAHRPALQLTLWRQSNSGPGLARNKGAAHATGQFLAFTDDDCAPREGWLRALDATLTRRPDALVGGTVLNGLRDNPNAEASQHILEFFREHYNHDPDNCIFFPSNNIAIAAALYRQIGGFDPEFRRNAAEDRDFCDRWLRSGSRLVLAPDACILHFRDMSFPGFWVQHYRYGRGAFTYATARRQRNGGLVQFEGWGVHAKLIAFPLRKSLRPGAFYLSFLVFVAQFANLIGYFMEARTVKRQSVPTRYNLARK
jgi:GT2 family glycosyltransferase